MICRYTLSDKTNKERKAAGDAEERPSKTFDRSATKQSLVAGGTFEGDPYPLVVMFKAAKVDPRWQMDFFVKVNGKEVKCTHFATPHGGQTAKSFRH